MSTNNQVANNGPALLFKGSLGESKILTRTKIKLTNSVSTRADFPPLDIIEKNQTHELVARIIPCIMSTIHKINHKSIKHTMKNVIHAEV